MYNRVVMWGCKYNFHSHGYIHIGLLKAFNNMGFEVHWFDNPESDALHGFDFKNTIFITLGGVDDFIPIEKDAFYIVHNRTENKYEEEGLNYIDLYQYQYPCKEGISYMREKSNVCEEISDLFYWDKKGNCAYMAWATDLLPEEIDKNIPVTFDERKPRVNYVGSVNGSRKEAYDFWRACNWNRKPFKLYHRVSIFDNMKIIQDSYISIDIRPENHKTNGYIPCRVFKNISYGRMTGTNSKYVFELFDEKIAFSNNEYNLYSECVEKDKNSSSEKIKELMDFVREKHTFINRATGLLYIANNK